MSSIDPYIDDSIASASTASVSVRTNGVESSSYSSLGSKYLCAYWSSGTYRKIPMRSSFTIYIYSSLIVSHYSGVLIVLTCIFRHRKASFPTIDIHVDMIFEFAWIHRYAEYRYVFPI